MKEWINDLGIKALNFFIYIGGTFNLTVGTVFQVFVGLLEKKNGLFRCTR